MTCLWPRAAWFRKPLHPDDSLEPVIARGHYWCLVPTIYHNIGGFCGEEDFQGRKLSKSSVCGQHLITISSSRWLPLKSISERYPYPSPRIPTSVGSRLSQNDTTLWMQKGYWRCSHVNNQGPCLSAVHMHPSKCPPPVHAYLVPIAVGTISILELCPKLIRATVFLFRNTVSAEYKLWGVRFHPAWRVRDLARTHSAVVIDSSEWFHRRSDLA